MGAPGHGRYPQNAFNFSNRRLDNGIALVLALIANANIYKYLRILAHAALQLMQRLAGGYQRIHQLNPGQNAVSCGVVVQENDMSRLLATQVISAAAHFFHDVAVADCRFAVFSFRLSHAL